MRMLGLVSLPRALVMCLLGLALFAPARSLAQPTPSGAAHEPSAERTRIDLRLRELDRQLDQHSYTKPVTMIAVGMGLTFGLAFNALWRKFMDEMDGGDSDSGEYTADERRRVRSLAVTPALGLGLAIGGAVWLRKQRRARDVLAPEYKALKKRRQQLEAQLTPSLDRNTLGLALTGRF